MRTGALTILLLTISNLFMTLAWYGHLRFRQLGVEARWGLAGIIALSWGIALLEYCFQVPANRIGFQANGGPFNLFQLKMIQEVLSLLVFTAFALLVFRTEKFSWNYGIAFLLLLAAVYFTFRK